MHKLAIITVAMDFQKCGKFLRSLSSQTDKDFHLYIVDIRAKDDTPSLPLKNVTILKRENKGYAYGINEGIKQARKDGIGQFCVMNDDIFFAKDFVVKAKKALAAHPDAIIGGKIYYAAGYEYHKDRYTNKDLGTVLWYAGGHVDWAHAQTVHRGVNEVDVHQFDSFETTGFVTGCLMLFDKRIVDKIGYLDESYFLYFEDTDYCERATRAQITLFYDPSLVIWHMVSQSTGGSGSSMQVRYQQKNLVKFALIYAPLRTKYHVLKNYFFARTKRE